MSRVAVAIVCLFIFLSVSAPAQLAPQGSQPAPVGLGQSDRPKIESALQRYLAAYVRRSLPDLLAVWPDLGNQKKEYEKIKRHLADPSVSAVQLTVQLLEIEPTNDGAVVRAHRTEQFVQTETASTTTGDLRKEVGQVYQGEKKTNVKKSADVWITMRKLDDAWIIASINEKKPK